MSTNTREKLLDAAVEIFSKKGYHKTKMEEIANKAGVAKGTVYYNFDSKADLFAQLLIEGINMIRDRLGQELNENTDAETKVKGLIKHSLIIFLRYDRLARIFFNELGSGIDKKAKKLIRQVQEKYYNLISRTLAAGIAEGEFKDLNPDILAGSLIGLMGGTLSVYLEIAPEKREEGKMIINQTIEVFLSGIKKKMS